MKYIIEPIEEIESFFFEIIKKQNYHILRLIVFIPVNEKIIQIFNYDGYSNQLNRNYIGLSFDIDNLHDYLVNHGDFSTEIEIEKMKKDHFFIFEKIKNKKVNVYIKKFFLSLNNNLLGTIVSISDIDISDKLKKIFEINDSDIIKLLHTVKSDFEQKTLFNPFITAFMKMLQISDPYTYYHTLRVTDIAAVIAFGMGYSAEKIYFIRTCGYIHDLGKLFISRDVLYKNDKLTDEEYEKVKQHIDKLSEIFEDNEFMKPYVRIAVLHHERLDGSGYMKLKADEIPDEARILAIADIFDAITHERPYKKAYNPEKALKELNKMADEGKIDKKILKIASEILPDFYKGFFDITNVTMLVVGKEVTVYDNNNKKLSTEAIIRRLIGNIIEAEMFDDLNFEDELTILCETSGLFENYNAKLLNIENRILTMKVLGIDMENQNVKTILNDPITIKSRKVTKEVNLNILTITYLVFTVEENLFYMNEDILIMIDIYGESAILFGNIRKIVNENFIFRYYVEFSEKNVPDMLIALNRIISKRNIEFSIDF